MFHSSSSLSSHLTLSLYSLIPPSSSVTPFHPPPLPSSPFDPPPLPFLFSFFFFLIYLAPSHHLFKFLPFSYIFILFLLFHLFYPFSLLLSFLPLCSLSHLSLSLSSLSLLSLFLFSYLCVFLLLLSLSFPFLSLSSPSLPSFVPSFLFLLFFFFSRLPPSLLLSSFVIPSTPLSLVPLCLFSLFFLLIITLVDSISFPLLSNSIPSHTSRFSDTDCIFLHRPYKFFIFPAVSQSLSPIYCFAPIHTWLRLPCVLIFLLRIYLFPLFFPFSLSAPYYARTIESPSLSFFLFLSFSHPRLSFSGGILSLCISFSLSTLICLLSLSPLLSRPSSLSLSLLSLSIIPLSLSLSHLLLLCLIYLFYLSPYLFLSPPSPFYLSLICLTFCSSIVCLFVFFLPALSLLLSLTFSLPLLLLLSSFTSPVFFFSFPSLYIVLLSLVPCPLLSFYSLFSQHQ
ncbi:hypothetical protein C7M84_002423 [Penaeus vannamei]|uniref:Uncharacterized protein n=1 Tax=Penaeus vannamei TaxID=6689 RepID=A0A423TQZ7_PENVA|nr:hypothetical protein C7M84_002423 [Penaeus vannamei]